MVPPCALLYIAYLSVALLLVPTTALPSVALPDLLYLSNALFSLEWKMPGKHAPVKLAARRLRALERGFLSPCPLTWKYVAVKDSVALRTKHIAKSPGIHEQHNMLAGRPSHHANAATEAVRGTIEPCSYAVAKVAHKQANLARHLWTPASLFEQFPLPIVHIRKENFGKMDGRNLSVASNRAPWADCTTGGVDRPLQLEDAPYAPSDRSSRSVDEKPLPLLADVARNTGTVTSVDEAALSSALDDLRKSCYEDSKDLVMNFVSVQNSWVENFKAMEDTCAGACFKAIRGVADKIEKKTTDLSLQTAKHEKDIHALRDLIADMTDHLEEIDSRCPDVVDVASYLEGVHAPVVLSKLMARSLAEWQVRTLRRVRRQDQPLRREARHVRRDEALQYREPHPLQLLLRPEGALPSVRLTHQLEFIPAL